MRAVDPGLPAGRLRARPTTVLFVARVLGGVVGGHGLPDDARADHGAVVRAGAHEVDRAVVGARRRDRGARPAGLRRRCSSTSGGARSSWSRCRWPWSRSSWRWSRAGPRERGDRAGRQPRRHPLGRAGRRADPRDQLRAGAEQGRRWRSAWRRSPLAAGVAFFLRQRRRDEPALRPAHRGAARSSGSRPAPGIIVFGSLMGAMFVGQQFLQNVLGYSTLEAGAAFLPAVVVHGAGRAALGQARRDARRALHAALRLRLLPARLPHHAAAVEGGHLLLAGRARLRASSASASASPARPPRTR